MSPLSWRATLNTFQLKQLRSTGKLPDGAELGELHKEYQSLKPSLEASILELALQTSSLLGQHGIQLEIPIQYRIKTWDSVVEKITRKSLKVKSLKTFPDLIGLRLILLFERDVQKVCQLLTELFVVVDHEDTSRRLGDDQFGYLSVHYTVTLGGSRARIPSLQAVSGFLIDIQVRSVAQHVWAAATHVLQYKKLQNIPSSVRRAINRVSALLETVDQELERALQARDAYMQKVKQELDPTAELNVDLVQHILDKHLPRANKDDEKGESYDLLLTSLVQCGIGKPTELLSLIQKHLRQTLKDDARFVRLYRKESTHSARIRRGVFYTHAGLISLMLQYRSPEISYVSPDGGQRATFGFSNKFVTHPWSASQVPYESKLRILDRRGKQLARFDFSSRDGDHGRVVTFACWSPDSKFFVFTTSSSGGHSPWQFVTYFYNRETGQLGQLFKHTGPVMKPEFSFVGEHSVKLVVQDLERWESEMFASKEIIVDLSTCADEMIVSPHKIAPTQRRLAAM